MLGDAIFRMNRSTFYMNRGTGAIAAQMCVWCGMRVEWNVKGFPDRII